LIVSIAMLDIADALGDAEAYLAEYRDHSPEALTVPAIAAAATRVPGPALGVRPEGAVSPPPARLPQTAAGL